MKNIGFPKNEGCTRIFLGRGNAAPQAMNFIVIKFEQAKRALTMPHFLSIYSKDVDFDEYRKKNDMRAVKKNCTLPSWLNYEAEKANINFSQLLQQALIQKLNLTNRKSN